MSQKTPSENCLDLVDEIKAEFSGRFQKTGQKAAYLIKAHPKMVFISMVMLIILSGVVSFLRPIENQLDQTQNDFEESIHEGANATSTELGLLLDLGGRAKRMYVLQQQIETLLSKETLSLEDSLFLDKALEELEYFENHKQTTDEDQME